MQRVQLGRRMLGSCEFEARNLSVGREVRSRRKSVVTNTGTWSVTCETGRTFGDCAETIPLQQSWVWFDGSQGIEPQHFMLCWSGVIADMQSANCKPNKATIATTMSSLFLMTLH